MKHTERTRFKSAAAVLEELPATVKAERKRRGLSLRQAGEQMGIAWTTLHHIESGDHNPRVNNAVAMLRWLATA